MSQLEETIEFLEAVRQTHVEWAEWQEENPKWEELVDHHVGDREHHLEMIEGYDQALTLLRNP